MHGYPAREVIRLYRAHPLQEGRILARVRGQRGSLEGIDELDLARDRATGITDQNHIGGLAFVRGLAARAAVRAEDRVLDLGCGLGGSARALAHLHACRVHGVDLSPERCAQAERLTERVGLGQRVSFECADFLRMPVPERAWDLLWGQSAWGHVADKAAFLRRWCPALGPRGRIAFEEPCLLRAPRSGAQRVLLGELEACWKSWFVSREAWLALLPAGFAATVVEDLSDPFLHSFERLMRIAREAGVTRRNSSELEGWHHARTLAGEGVLGYLRVVAVQRG